MKKIKFLIKKIPILSSFCKFLINHYLGYKLKNKKANQLFTEIYKKNSWNGKDSVSGRGSDINQTITITKELPLIFKDLFIKTILDIPCGDFHWMRNVDLLDINYIGADIVVEITEKNSKQYGNDKFKFQTLDLSKDILPKVDLIFCRDCLVHLSFDEVFSSLKNICRSNSKYLLTTTFTKRFSNRNIITGQWRRLNLNSAPFNLPVPLKIINEKCTEANGSYKDKSLGLWKISDVVKSLP